MATNNNDKNISNGKKIINFTNLLKINKTYFLIALLLIGSLLVGILFLKTQNSEQENSQTISSLNSNPAVSQAPADNKGPKFVSIDDDPSIGDENAPITIIEFSDYECPVCKRFFENTLPQIKKIYIDTGKVKFVYRDLPLEFHEPMATKEAIAANCAREQGEDEKYFQYHDEMFRRTSSNGNGLNDEDLIKIAIDLRLNLDKFQTCQKDPSQADEVANDLADAIAAGATGTPSFFIGKSTPGGITDVIPIVGGLPLATYTQVIDALLES